MQLLGTNRVHATPGSPDRMGQDGATPGLRTMFDPVMERACLGLMQGDTGVPAPDGESESFRRLFEGLVLDERL